jgi:Ca2+-transporting ATPase
VLLHPVHIVFAELLIDPACSVVFEMEEEEKGSFQRPPRNIKQHIISFFDLLLAFLQGAIILAACIGIYWFNVYHNSSYTFNEFQINGMVFCTLLVGNLGLIVTNRSKTVSCFSLLCVKNKAFFIIVPLAFCLLMLSLYIPGLRTIFHSDVIPFVYLLEAIGSGLITSVVHEFLKVFFIIANFYCFFLS